MGKLQVVVIFGGQSSEHIVSCMSAVNVINHIDRERYNLLLIGITQEGRWLKVESAEAVRAAHGRRELFARLCFRMPQKGVCW